MAISTEESISLIEGYLEKNYRNNFREPAERFPYPFLVPGSAYKRQLWDWDSWLTGVALLAYAPQEVEPYEKGCVLDYLASEDGEGRIPILVQEGEPWDLFVLHPGVERNIHKPCLAQHALAISRCYEDYEWIREGYPKLKKFISYYQTHQYHEESGLYFWLDDLGLGFDNDPTVIYRPYKGTAAIYLNSLMYSELLAMSELASGLGEQEDAKRYGKDALALKEAIRRECYDPKTHFFYSADLTLRPIDPNEFLHKGYPRFYHSLPIRIETWAGFLPCWNGVASEKEAEACIRYHFQEDSPLNSPNGLRSVAKDEPFYRVVKSGNPSCWLGPIWINASYFLYEGLKAYGHQKEAKELAEKTINLLGRDLKENGDFHEYYDPDTGDGINNPGFQSWNFLVILMIQDLKGHSIR